MLTKTLTKLGIWAKMENIDFCKFPNRKGIVNHRGVAQPGSALGSGPRSREFKSPLPDHIFAWIP